MPLAPSERERAAAMPPSREPRSTAGRPAARLGEDDSWGMAAARSWSSAAAVEAAASSSDAGRPPPSGFDHAELSEEELDEPPTGAAGRELPALGSRLRVWWPPLSQWFEGKVDKIVVQDGRSIQRVRYDDNDVRWYDWSGPKAPPFEILAPPAALCATRANPSAAAVDARRVEERIMAELRTRGEIRAFSSDEKGALMAEMGCTKHTLERAIGRANKQWREELAARGPDAAQPAPFYVADHTELEWTWRIDDALERLEKLYRELNLPIERLPQLLPRTPAELPPTQVHESYRIEDHAWRAIKGAFVAALFPGEQFDPTVRARTHRTQQALSSQRRSYRQSYRKSYRQSHRQSQPPKQAAKPQLCNRMRMPSRRPRHCCRAHRRSA